MAGAAGTARGLFVGREREVADIGAALDRAVAGRGHLYLVNGEPGIGKTRLAQEIAALADARGATVLWGRCWEGGGAPAYWPWIQALRTYVRTTEPERLRDELGPGAGHVARLLPEAGERTGNEPAQGVADPEQARFAASDRRPAREEPNMLANTLTCWRERRRLAT